MREPTKKKLNVFPSISMALLLFKKCDLGHLFMCLGHLCVFFGKTSIYFCPFFDVFFFLLSVMSCLYILEINPLSAALFANIFFHSEGCLFYVYT